MNPIDPHTHLLLHTQRAAELQAAAYRPVPRTPLRTQLGWLLVELGLRLATPRVPGVVAVSS
ncbi:hypothetical protein [Streptomyces luteolus]|uniref:Amidohydrolase n=1 Tax=Streptomyces luteolus TaxID=3043615 RepID=A0ABT6T077_9ACTN|nr:hypothetical protein [Streptomyces sp. B-S-A12]MDI3421267.1 hypothetical protein [Streptomyces sp. B-S-A12]